MNETGRNSTVQIYNHNNTQTEGRSKEAHTQAMEQMQSQQRRLPIRSPVSLGIETADDIFSPVIPRNTILPCTCTQIFSTYTDQQKTVEIKVYQGERSSTRHNQFLGRFDVAGLRPAARGVPKLDVTFSLDEFGRLVVYASESMNGQTKNLTVHCQFEEPAKYWQPERIASIMRDAQINKHIDQQMTNRIAAKSRFEQYIYGLRTSIDHHMCSSLLTSVEHKMVGRAQSDSMHWLRQHESATAQQYDEQLRRIQSICQPIVRRMYEASAATTRVANPSVQTGNPLQPTFSDMASPSTISHAPPSASFAHSGGSVISSESRERRGSGVGTGTFPPPTTTIGGGPELPIYLAPHPSNTSVQPSHHPTFLLPPTNFPPPPSTRATTPPRPTRNCAQYGKSNSTMNQLTSTSYGAPPPTSIHAPTMHTTSTPISSTISAPPSASTYFDDRLSPIDDRVTSDTRSLTFPTVAALAASYAADADSMQDVPSSTIQDAASHDHVPPSFAVPMILRGGSHSADS